MTIDKIKPFNYMKFAQDNPYSSIETPAIIEEPPVVYTPKVPQLGKAVKKLPGKNVPVISPVAPVTQPKQQIDYNPNVAQNYLKRVMEVEDIDEFMDKDEAKFVIPKSHFKDFLPPMPWTWQNDSQKSHFANLVWDKLINPLINIDPEEVSQFLTKTVGQQYFPPVPVDLADRYKKKEEEEQSVVVPAEERGYTPEQLAKRKINELTQDSSIHAQMYMKNQSPAMQELLGRNAADNEDLARLQSGFGAAIADLLSDQKKYLYFSRHDEALPQNIRVEFQKLNINPRDKKAFLQAVNSNPQLKSQLDDLLSQIIQDIPNTMPTGDEDLGDEEAMFAPLERDLINRAKIVGGTKAGGLQLGQMGEEGEGGVAGNVSEGEKPVPLEPITQRDVEEKIQRINDLSVTVTPKIKKVSDFSVEASDQIRKVVTQIYKVLKTPEKERTAEQQKFLKDGFAKGLTPDKIQDRLLDVDFIDMIGKYVMNNLAELVHIDKIQPGQTKGLLKFKDPKTSRLNVTMTGIKENGEVVDYDVNNLRSLILTKDFSIWFDKLLDAKRDVLHKKLESPNKTYEQIAEDVKKNTDLPIVNGQFVAATLLAGEKGIHLLNIAINGGVKTTDKGKTKTIKGIKQDPKNNITTYIVHKMPMMMGEFYAVVNKDEEHKQKYTPAVMSKFFKLIGAHKFLKDPFFTNEKGEFPIDIDPADGKQKYVKKTKNELNGLIETEYSNKPFPRQGATSVSTLSNGIVKTNSQMYYDMIGIPFPDIYLKALQAWGVLTTQDVQEQLADNKEIIKSRGRKIMEAKIYQKDRIIYGIYDKAMRQYEILNNIRNNIKQTSVLGNNVKFASVNNINILIGKLLLKTQKQLFKLKQM